MSQVRTSQSCIKNHKFLGRACDRMREAGIRVEGPRYEKSHPGAQYGTKQEAWLVKLPSARVPLAFYCDDKGTTRRDTDTAYGGIQSEFDRLQVEYRVAAMEDYAAEVGGQLQNVTITEDQTEANMELVIG
jgi:hypothetical protein